MRTSDATPFLPDLELSQQPELRRAQVDILVKVLGALESNRISRVMPWESMAKLADSSAVVEATNAWLASATPSSGRFESFEALATQRDATGMVRLPRL